MKALTIRDCNNEAEKKGGKCLNTKYVNSAFKYLWRCNKGHEWRARYTNIQQGSWCPHCIKLTIEDCYREAKKRGGACLNVEYNGARAKYLWRCNKGHEWEAMYTNIQQGSWCPHCVEPHNKLTIENCYREAEKRGGLCLNTEYNGVNAKYTWQCSKNHNWQATYQSLKNGSWCPYCAGLVKLTIEDCYKLAENKGGKCLNVEYINANFKYLWTCKKGHEWEATYANVQYGTWCPHCARLAKLTIEDCYKEAEKRGGACLSAEYNGANDKYKWQCGKKHIWQATYSMIQQGAWCPYCAGNAKLDLSYCKKTAQFRGGECLSTEYKGASAKYKWQCSKKHIWEATYNNIKQGKWCPKCKAKTQTFIYNVCEKMFPDYDIKYNFKGFDWLKTNKKGKLELDIYIPELKLAMEYDGEQHFKPTTFNGISYEEAKQRFETQQANDNIKNSLIKGHPEDVAYFIRFNYQEDITEEYIIDSINSLIKADKETGSVLGINSHF